MYEYFIVHSQNYRIHVRLSESIGLETVKIKFGQLTPSVTDFQLKKTDSKAGESTHSCTLTVYCTTLEIH